MQDLINDTSTFLVDVRTPTEVAEQSVKGATNIPLDTVPDNLDKFKEAKGAVVVFCRSGGRSENAKNWLKQNGVENVHNAGGIGDVLVYKM
jgi:rhodanese-related sulfurtransferase